MDAIALLKQDHRTVDGLFEKFEATTDRAVKTRQTLADRIVKELSIHAAIEEQILYPGMRRALKNGDKLVAHAIEEHQDAKELLKHIERTPASEPKLADLVADLASAIREHVKEEESDLFKRLRTEVDRKTLETWADELKAAKRISPTRPHPLAPNRPPANVVAGSAAGVVDRLRDAGRKLVRGR